MTVLDATRTVTIGADGTWEVTFTQAEVPGGEYETAVTVTATDIHGNVSTVTDMLAIDTVMDVAFDGGPVTADNVVNAAEMTAGVTLTGTADAGSHVTVTVGTVAHDVVAGADGSWSVVFASGEIAGGERDVRATVSATDAAGNTATDARLINLDTQTHVEINPTQAGDNVISGAERVAAGGVPLVGTAEAGSTVVVTMGRASHTVTAGADGTWRATFTAAEIPAGESTATINVTATDLAGNTASATQSIQIDTAVTRLTHTTATRGLTMLSTRLRGRTGLSSRGRLRLDPASFCALARTRLSTLR